MKAPVPVPVRVLWASASTERQATAHEVAQQLLAYWLGVKSKAEVSRELGVTPLRVWQLSRAGMCGLVCGLLPQPRWRGGKSMSHVDPNEDPKALKKRLAAVESELEVAKQLIKVLRTLPGNDRRGVAKAKKRPKPGKSSPKRQAPDEESAASRRGKSPEAKGHRGE